MVDKKQITEQIKERIENSENILVALSKNPSVDEMATAIGLTMLLDDAGKHATAIYSGETPNALEFLKPEETFEANTNSLQDFIVALNKEKADHLRYKVEGDYVRIYITPYKTEISENDLEFSHGDFNVDLVIALNVKAAEDLDAALAEYGRILHDASTINITTADSGQFAEIKWADDKASSVGEMVAQLITTMPEVNEKMNAEVATAFLTGIVAATDRFSNEKTSPETMEIASDLMKKGADQKLIADNMELTGQSAAPAPEAEAAPEVVSEPTPEPEPEKPAEDQSILNVHNQPAEEPEQNEATQQLEQMIQPSAISQDEIMMEQLRQTTNNEPVPAYNPGDNPAANVAPAIEDKEANNIPEMDFGGAVTEPIISPAEPEVAPAPEPIPEPTPTPEPESVMPADIELPPPPTPPIDLGAETPLLPDLEPDPSQVTDEKTGEPETSAADQLLPNPDADGGLIDPGSFQIPGM